MINKVQPVNNTLDYWHKYRGYAHKILYKYTNDDDMHGNLDFDLYMLFKRITGSLDSSRNINSYIRLSIKGIIYRLLQYKGYNNKDKAELVDLQELDIKDNTNLDIDLDTYLARNLLFKYISLFNKRDQEILKMYYGLVPYEKHTLKEIAKYFNVSTNMIHLIKDRVLKKLKRFFKANNNKLEDFIYE